jgi:long-chain acyl-CoA synthetase
MKSQTRDIISLQTANTLHGLFLERVRRTPDKPAYRYFNRESNTWEESTWAEMDFHIDRWQTALKGEHLNPGDRVAILINNCREWVMMDQAALGLGLVVVPLYRNDRPENIVYILKNAGVKLLLIEDESYWQQLDSVQDRPKDLIRVLSLCRVENKTGDSRLRCVNDWLPEKGDSIKKYDCRPDDLATIVYTSGTTGHPKGVMLSHRNILWNAYSGLQSVAVFQEDIFLSFLPLSHTLERTVGYYLPVMTGATVAYARSIPKLKEDLTSVRPTILVSVPRIFERVYSKIKSQLEEKKPTARNLFDWTVTIGWNRFEYLQKRGKWNPAFLAWPLLDRLVAAKIRKGLGGRLRLSVVGGATLSTEIAKDFIGLGVHLLHGYGLTETSPVISVNLLEDNVPESVGVLYQDVEARIGKNSELLIKGPGVMLGYWNNPEATGNMIDSEGWLHTGDKADIKDGRIYITGRIKEIIVMSNGEKVPPTNIETVIERDPLIEQAIVIGEGKPYLSALVVLSSEGEERLAADLNMNPDNPAFLKSSCLQEYMLERISGLMRAFPGYAIIRRVALLDDPWTVENGFMTPTLKLRRRHILKYYSEKVSTLYEGHEVFA